MKKTKKEISNPFHLLLRDPNRFKKLGDGWICDRLCGIEWGPSSKERMNFAEAKEYCAELEGRVPEINELQSLVDYSKHSPAIDTRFFSDTKTDNWYWTGTEVAGNSGLAWFVGFGLGNVDFGSKGSGNYVRPVRSSQ